MIKVEVNTPPCMPTWIVRLAALCSRCEAQARQQPTAEAAILIAIRRASGTLLLVRFCNQDANLGSRHDNRTLMAMRLVVRHGLYQEFKIVGHAVLREMRRALRKRPHALATHPYIKGCAEV